MARENKHRDAEPPDHTFDDVYIVTTDEDGNRTEVKVPKVRIGSSLINLYSLAYGMPRTGVPGFDRPPKQGL